MKFQKYQRAGRACLTFFSFISLIALDLPAQAQTRAECEQQFTPRSGQSGKDVMWVATIDQLVVAMLRAAKVTSTDRVIDLGSGDGKIPIAAAKYFGAHALGIEYNSDLVQLARCYARAEHVTDKVKFRQADLFTTDFGDATVLTLYLSPSINLKLRPILLGMRPGTRVVSNSFDMAQWRADALIESEIGNTRAYLWIVPAQVDGEWTFTETAGRMSFTIALKQQFQMLQSVPARDGHWGVREGRLNGTAIELTIVGHDGRPIHVKGRVEKDRIEARSEDGVPTHYVGLRSKG
jgi:SAM-dependent methyltransferase